MLIVGSRKHFLLDEAEEKCEGGKDQGNCRGAYGPLLFATPVEIIVIGAGEGDEADGRGHGNGDPRVEVCFVLVRHGRGAGKER